MDEEAEHREPSDQSVVPVCAIGGSAGGVAALQGLFRQLSTDLGLAYVVILHLSPDQPSALSEILSICTRMPVLQVEDGPTLRPNCVYVIPPDRELVIQGDSVTARAFTEPRGQRAPIDMFFRSIAAGRGDGIAIVLSGAGADGSVGVRAIKEAGGVIMVQEPAEAGFASMPQNAIATGVADFVAPLARLAERVAEVARSKEAVRSLDMDSGANDLRRIVAFLRARTGNDFSGYKRATVMRRVARRMQVCRTDTLARYADHLLATPEEAKELLSDLLISVTMFFRDATAFEALERRVIKPLFDDFDLDADENLRAWVVGCATGEEAYSVAMLLHEEAARRKMRAQIQVFATDLDEVALKTAREGRYPRSIEADVSDARLARFFIDEGTHYRVRKELRESVLFASHSVIREPPFMRLDLITCRNLLIYLERSLQQQICSIFHYSLKPARYLFLGSAETADAAADLFAPLDREARIYSARPQAARVLPSLPQFAAPEKHPEPGHPLPSRNEHASLPATMHLAALESSAPASALVDERHNILHLSPGAGRFILHSGGPPSNMLPAVVRPELRLDLRLALARVIEQKEQILTHPVVVAFEGDRRRVAMHVAPVPVETEVGAQALVLFLDGGHAAEIEMLAPEANPDQAPRLYAELKAAQEALIASRTGQEAAIQDLRATNEELQSTNEEYRSTAEELETSKEELQSINEELHTVNAELKSKLESISVAHSDLQNLTAATEIGTLFLDADLRIKMFTPPIADLFNVTKADYGRTITDFSHRLDYDGIDHDARQVLRNLAPIEREVHSRDARSYVLRMRPYRTIEDRIDGVVVTFFDITDRLQAEAALRKSEENYHLLFNSIDEGFCVIEVIFDEHDKAVDYRFLQANPAFERQTGLTNAVGRTMRDMVPNHEQHWFDIYGEISRTGRQARFEDEAAELGRWYDVSAFRVGEPEQRRVGILFRDIVDRKRAELVLRESEERQAFLLRLSDALRPLADPGELVAVATRLLGEHLAADRAFLTEVEADGTTLHVRDESLRAGASSVLGQYSFDQFGEFVSRELHQGRVLAVEDVSALADLTAAERANYAAIDIAAYLLIPLLRDGRLASYFTINHRTAREWSGADRAIAVQTAERTWAAVERARAEVALRDSEALRRIALAGGGMGSWRWDLDKRLVWGDAKFLALWGLPPSDEPHPLSHFTDRMSAEGANEVEVIVTKAIAAGEEFDGPLEIVSGPTAGRWIRWRGRPDGGAPSTLYGVSFDITEQRRMDRALRESEARLSQFGEASQDVLWIRDPETFQWVYLTPAFETIYGLDREAALRGDTMANWLELIVPEDRERAASNLRRVHDGEQVGFEYRIRRPRDGEIRWLRNTDFPMHDAAGKISGIGGVGRDVTEEKLSADRMEVLLAELQHRTRNLMGVVRATAETTLRASQTLDDFAPRFRDRLAALARVQGLLSRLGDGDRVTFDELIEAELAALGATNGSDHVTLDGPRGIALRSSMVQTFALALHELATNAVKYGALRQPEGRLDIRWRLTQPEPGGQPWLDVEWHESGVTMPAPEATSNGSGSGRKLIEEALPYQLGARTTFVMAPDGVRCTISLPVSRQVTNGDATDRGQPAG